MPLGALHRHVQQLVGRHHSHWRKDAGEPGAEVGLTASTVERLEALRLVRRTDEGVVPLPAVGRYALDRSGQMDPTQADGLLGDALA